MVPVLREYELLARVDFLEARDEDVDFDFNAELELEGRMERPECRDDFLTGRCEVLFLSDRGGTRESRTDLGVITRGVIDLDDREGGTSNRSSLLESSVMALVRESILSFISLSWASISRPYEDSRFSILYIISTIVFNCAPASPFSSLYDLSPINKRVKHTTRGREDETVIAHAER